MSTERKTKMVSHLVNQFWGGDDRGVCLQITARDEAHGESYIQVTMEEATELCYDLGEFIREEAIRRWEAAKKY